MPLSERWRDQYERMLRSHRALTAAAGPSAIGPDEARDTLYRFFQEAYHLKDWVKNSPTSHVHTAKAGAVVEDIFDSAAGLPHMQIAADICNGIKHLVLTRRTKTGDNATAVDSQSVAVGLPTFVTRVVYPGSPAERNPQPEPTETPSVEYRWTISSNGQTFDTIDIANKVVAEWQHWLQAKKLL